MGSSNSTPNQVLSVSPSPSPCGSSTDVIKKELSFEEMIVRSRDELNALETEVKELIRDHAQAENEAKEYPLELRETSEELESRHTTLLQSCIRLEELLVRVQLNLDGTQLPRTLIDGNEVPDPDARSTRKQIVQEAEQLIQQLQQIRSEGNAKL